MALTSAEKQRRYREKRDKDPERRRQYLKKEKAKKEIPINIQSLSLQLKRRNAWRKAQHKKRYETGLISQNHCHKIEINFH